MASYRRRRNQNADGLILLAVILVLWYLGRIPGVPPMTTVLPELKIIGTYIPTGTELAPLIPQATPAATIQAASGLGRRTKTSGCVAANGLPDPACTPGGILPEATTKQICTIGYTSKIRAVPQSVKEAAYAEYGISSHEPGQYEVDHLIPLELGGSNDIANLFPEAAEPRPGFHEKDQVENYLHDQVCSGALSLPEAQTRIAHDWVTIYQNMPK